MEESHISIVQVQRDVEKDVKEEDITSMEKKKNREKCTFTILYWYFIQVLKIK